MRPIKILFGACLVLLLVVVGLPQRNVTAWASTRTAEVSWATTTDGVWVSDELEAPVTLVGLSWAEGEPESVSVRFKARGQWGPWTPIPIEADHGPDPNTAEGRNQSQATDSIWVGESDAVQFMATGEEVAGAEATLIDTTNRTKPLSKRLTDLFTPTVDQADGAPNQPAIHPRADWDPSNSCAPKSSPSFVQVTHAFVHHTTGSNNESQAQIPGHVLAICLYHRNSNGWDDIGYNYLIDRFGGIWEGRAGGIANGVQGAHTVGFNSYSTGVAFIGDHTSSGPTPAAEASLKSLLAWKFGVHNVDPTNSSILVSKGSSKWPEGKPVLFRPISGHRDAQSTSCPGEACYQRMPTYRSGVDALWDQVPLGLYRSPLVGDFDGDGAPEGALFKTTNGVWSMTERDGTTSTWADFYTASGWSSQIVGDFNGDGRDDIANFHPSNGTWWVNRSIGSSSSTALWADFSTASGWSRQIVGDFNGDGKDDIANFHPSNGTWWVSRSADSGFITSLWADFSTASGWSSQIVGDFDGDGKDDIANFHPSNGTWWVSRSTGSGFTTSLWADFSTASGWTTQIVGDFSGDGKDDIANRHSSNGTWWVSRSGGSSFSTTLWGTTASAAGLGVVFVQDVDSNGRVDIVAIDSYNGFVVRHLSSGSSFAIGTMTDTPWRTTLSYSGVRDARGNDALVYYGQEFGWIRISALASSSGNATLVHSFPRS